MVDRTTTIMLRFPQIVVMAQYQVSVGIHQHGQGLQLRLKYKNYEDTICYQLSSYELKAK